MVNVSPVALAALASAALASTSLAFLPSSRRYRTSGSSVARAAPLRPPPPPPAGSLLSNPRSRTAAAAAAVGPLAAEKYTPFGVLGDMASSLFSSGGGGGGGGGGIDPQFDAQISSLPSKSWNEIRSDLEAVQTPEERRFRSDLEFGYGATGSPLHKLRLYDESNREEDVRVTLYRDSASWCPYCQKVWLTLEEKRIPYRVEKINMRCYGEKPMSFRRMQPSGAIPVAVIDGVTYNQSNDIIYALEEKFGDAKRLLPTDERGRAKAQQLLRLERQMFGAWMYWLTGPAQFKSNFVSVLEDVETELANSPGGDYFLGKDVSLVDFMFAPFLERTAASMAYFKGFVVRVPPGQKTPYPAINRWFDAMERLDSYRLTKSDYYTHCWDLPPQLGGCTHEDAGAAYERTVNGEDGSWDLPLKPHNGGVEPDWTWCGDESAAKREAAERLSFNRDDATKFAARGAGRKGTPPYSAPLSDPDAVPAEGVLAAVDAALRVVASALLEGTEARGGEMAEVARCLKENGGPRRAADVASSLGYLRDRVGVPRDMRLPAARQLRAHLNWAIRAIES